MGVSVSDTWSVTDDNAVPLGAVRFRAELRAACTPSNLAVLGLLCFGWIALIGWTGVGPRGWQARSCAGLSLLPAACQGVPPAKDASRIVPHGPAANLVPGLPSDRTASLAR